MGAFGSLFLCMDFHILRWVRPSLSTGLLDVTVLTDTTGLIEPVLRARISLSHCRDSQALECPMPRRSKLSRSKSRRSFRSGARVKKRNHRTPRDARWVSDLIVPCYYPLTAWRSRHRGPSGKLGVTFRLGDGYADMPLKLPCGQCVGCRLERSRQWAVRCVHEAQMHDRNCFITLRFVMLICLPMVRWMFGIGSCLLNVCVKLLVRFVSSIVVSMVRSICASLSCDHFRL